MGSRFSRLYWQEKKEKDSEQLHKDDLNEKKEKKNKAKVRIKKKMEQIIAIQSDKPIDPKKIKVNVSKGPERNKASPEPNFIPLTVLWAHFVAKQFGLLDRDRPEPWQILEDDRGNVGSKVSIDLSQNSWQNFLSNVITDTSWTQWIQDPDEVKMRTLMAFETL